MAGPVTVTGTITNNGTFGDYMTLKVNTIAKSSGNNVAMQMFIKFKIIYNYTEKLFD